MTCQELDERLDDWLDGSLPPADAALVETHLASCGGCREEARRLRQLLAHAAALPRSVAPGRDLWPGIEARIAEPRGFWRAFGSIHPMLLAAAALVVVSLGVVVWRQQARGIVRTAEIPAASPASFVAVGATVPEAVADPVLARAERDYEAATNALLAALQQRKRTLQPELLAGVETDLQVIDRALAEVRRALVKDPHNGELNRMLVSTHRKKLDVLRRIVRLSTTL